MTRDEALRALGLGADERDGARIRAAYLAAIRRAHPDVNAAATATVETERIIAAYRAAVAGPADGAGPRPAPVVPATRHPVADAERFDIEVIADDTIEVGAPVDLTYALLMQASHEAGDVTFVDRSAAILQILVTFADEPPCQVIFDLQGRAARGTTEIFCTIESLEDRPPPPIDAVTRFVAEQLRTTALPT